MVKFLPNNEYFDKDAILARTDPVKFAESGYQAKQQLKRSIVAMIDRNQNPGDLERGLKQIRISVPDLKGQPYLVRTHIYIHTQENGPIHLGDLLDLF